MDRGTGLGLSQVYGFAKQSQGDVSFETEAGLGTVFTITLPLSRETIQEEITSSQPQGLHGSLRVLLVEDNPEVRIVASDYLEALGYSVVTAESGERAVDILNGPNELDVVFSDIVLPGLSGVELARIVREHHPQVGVVLATGYSEKTAAAVADGFTLLQKPYTKENVRNALAKVARRGQIELTR
jgi:two-component system NtrC family sensor kinase